MRFLLLAIGLLLALPAAADIYKWTDADGHVVFSDQPHPGAEKLPEKEVPTFNMPAVPAVNPPAESKKPTPSAGYSTVKIMQPKNNVAFWDTAGEVTVETEIKPPLHTDLGHKLVLTMDGKPVAQSSGGTTFQLSNVDRGTHTLDLKVENADGKVLTSSAPVTFTIHRASILNRKRNTGH